LKSLEVIKLLPMTKFRSKIGVGKEIRRYWDSLAKLVKTPKINLFTNFATSVHIIDIG